MTRACAIAAALFFVLGAVAHAQRITPEEYRQAVAGMDSDAPQSRIDAVELLGRKAWRHRREVAPRLRQLLRHDADWRVRASSGRALSRLSVRAAVPDLVAALRDPQVEVRVVAAAALWRLPDPAAAPALREVLRDRDPAARQWAALALGMIRDARSVPPLAALLDDPEGSVRMDVVRSLGRIGDASALPPLRAFVEDDSRADDERLEAINALASLDSPDKVNALVRFLDIDDADIRLRAIGALGQVGDALALPALRRRRAGSRGRIRQAIDEAMGAIRVRMREQRQPR